MYNYAVMLQMEHMKGSQFSRYGAACAYLDICENCGPTTILEAGIYAETVKPKLSPEEWRQYKRGYHWMANFHGWPNFLRASRFQLVHEGSVTAEGVEWQDGSCSMCTLDGAPASMHYDSIEGVRSLFCTGTAEIEFLDSPILEGEQRWLKSEGGKMCHEKRKTWMNGTAELSLKDMHTALHTVLPDISSYLGRWNHHWKSVGVDPSAEEN